MAMYDVFVKTYGYASQLVEASSKEEAIEIAKNNPYEWGSSSHSWWHDDNHIIKVNEVNNMGTYVPNCEKNEVIPSFGVNELMEIFNVRFAPFIKELNELKGFTAMSVGVTDYGNVSANICENLWEFVQMITMNGNETNPTHLPAFFVDFTHPNKKVHEEIIECLYINSMDYYDNTDFIRVDIYDYTDLECLTGILARFQTKHYKWVASSDDGCYEVDSQHLFTDKCLCYCDMRNAALAKMKWNTNYDEDFADVCDGDYIGYEVQFYQDKIIHKSYSGTYTYEIVEC